MSKANKSQQFGTYLRQLRESRELTARAVEERIDKLFPDDKHYQLSHGHLIQIEQGKKPPPYPMKLKALAKVYGENYELMLYKAGYLDRNPMAEPKDWDRTTLRDLYLDEIAHAKGGRSLNEEEKHSLEKIIENVVRTFSGS